MTERVPEVSSPSKLPASPPKDDGSGDSELERADPKALQADYRLAQRCVDGEVAAWEELYRRYHDRLLGSILALLASRSEDMNLVDEIAARVWYALVDNDGELLSRYDPARGACLITFMRALAKDLVRRHFRSERRRLAREAIACDTKPTYHEAALDHSSTSLDEFRDTLSVNDREFCDEYLLDNPPGNGHADQDGLSPPNIWQKTRRIYKRLIRFFDGSS